MTDASTLCGVLVPPRAGQGRVQHLRDFLAAGEPLREHPGRLVLRPVAQRQAGQRVETWSLSSGLSQLRGATCRPLSGAGRHIYTVWGFIC